MDESEDKDEHDDENDNDGEYEDEEEMVPNANGDDDGMTMPTVASNKEDEDMLSDDGLAVLKTIKADSTCLMYPNNRSYASLAIFWGPTPRTHRSIDSAAGRNILGNV